MHNIVEDHNPSRAIRLDKIAVKLKMCGKNWIKLRRKSIPYIELLRVSKKHETQMLQQAADRKSDSIAPVHSKKRSQTQMLAPALPSKNIPIYCLPWISDIIALDRPEEKTGSRYCRQSQPSKNMLGSIVYAFEDELM